MSIRYSFRSEPTKLIFQFKGKCTSVEELQKHIEYKRGIINIDVVEPGTETVYKKNSILRRGMYVQIRTTIDTYNVSKKCKSVVALQPTVKNESPPKNESPKYNILGHRAEMASRKRKHQNNFVRPLLVKRRSVQISDDTQAPQRIISSKGLPKRFAKPVLDDDLVKKPKADHLKERNQGTTIIARGDISLNLNV